MEISLKNNPSHLDHAQMILYHISFSTHANQNMLTRERASRVQKVLEAYASEQGWRFNLLRVQPSYVQMLINLDSKLVVADVVKQFKALTTAEVLQELKGMPDIQLDANHGIWEDSFSVDTVKPSSTKRACCGCD